MASAPWPFFSMLKVCSFDNSGQLEPKDETNVDLERGKHKIVCKRCMSALVKEEISFYPALKYCLVVRDEHSC